MTDQRLGRLAHRPAHRRHADDGSISPMFSRRENMYFLYKAYVDFCHTQTKTEHIRLIKCNEDVLNLNVCLDDGPKGQTTGQGE